ncbi:SpoIIE family protein phosphatase [Candidatus Protochlamydia phocaeensis]|uniref:SpoIIE family protein phosphatase n=1 Tax=Candidatus Protochlamydia phocaeensis TaxID=1414722 RepID=UPI0009AE6100|nr:SpoIIE family protein phosphatase [Candidatus Protochlamydia phocaeensis]
MINNDSPLLLSSSLLAPLQAFPITVLLIDDQLIIAEAVRRMLNGQPDIIFHYCSDPSKALEMAAKVNPTVILQDLVMPECNGLTLVKYFRANPATKDVPIIVLSTKEEPQIKAEAFALGSNDYIVKLPDKLELIARIRYHSLAYIRLLERNEAFRRMEESQKVLTGELAEAAAYVKSLLPSPLKNGIEAEWCFIPSTQLGGDSFGYHWLDNRYFAMYLLDVCGHGVGAALLSISVANLLRSQNLPRADFKNPGSVLKALNLAFPMEKHNNMFFSIWYGIYDREAHQILYASGGHPPALLVTGTTAAQAQVYSLRTPGVVIGALPDTDFQNGVCQVLPYNCLYIYSDGIYEISKLNGAMLEMQEFIDLAVKSLSFKGKELEWLVHSSQQIQGKDIFADDVSILKINFKL